jgi:hypothetical protein
MSSLMDDESPMPSTSKPGVRGTFIDEADLAALTTAAERLQASFRDTMETLPSAKPMPVLEEAAIPDMVLTLPPKRTEMDVHTPPRSSEIVAIPPVFSPLEIASEPPPLKEAPLMVAILQKRATRAALLEAEEVALAMTSSATETAAVPHAEAPGASTATADARASTTPEPPRSVSVRGGFERLNRPGLTVTIPCTNTVGWMQAEELGTAGSGWTGPYV